MIWFHWTKATETWKLECKQISMFFCWSQFQNDPVIKNDLVIIKNDPTSDKKLGRY